MENERHFTPAGASVFALRNLPDAVKAALFARYSRSPKGLRQLFDSEFSDGTEHGGDETAGLARAERLLARVLDEYGDDSVAQLGSAHIACEGVSNVATKILERGRLMSYLEQSTRYVALDKQVDGRWRYMVPAEVAGSDEDDGYRQHCDQLFEAYSAWLTIVRHHLEAEYPAWEAADPVAHARAIRAAALDAVRGLLPASTTANVGLHGTGQAFEALLLRLGSHELAEARALSLEMHEALGRVIPQFIRRVQRADRGGVTRDFLRARHAQGQRGGDAAYDAIKPEDQARAIEAEVELIDFDPEAEVKVLTATVHPWSEAPLRAVRQALAAAQPDAAGLTAPRKNRRHRPTRGFEHADYLFEVTADYGAFRDLQRHRMLTIDWQPLTTRNGWAPAPAVLQAAGGNSAWERAMERACRVHQGIWAEHGPAVAQYCLPMAMRIRFTMRMNAREAMHLLELRTQPAGHPTYRRICQQMHRLIRDKAGHKAIAGAMSFVDHSENELGRLKAEERTGERQRTQGSDDGLLGLVDGGDEP